MQWKTNLIYFDAKASDDLCSTSWYMEELMSDTRFTTTRPVTTSTQTGPLYWVAGQNEDSGSYVFKAAVYNSTGDVPVVINLPAGSVSAGSQANLTVLTAPDGYSFNEMGKPNVVQTTTTILHAARDGSFSFSLPNLSIAVFASSPKSAGPGGWGGPWGWGGWWGGNGGYGGCRGGRRWGGWGWGAGNGC